ncbi:MAG: hypothetical protein K2K34_04265 [Oscillospiraceae bacterium]|nr:hypothetical protein [Oscillospiraceae bacterium]
MDGKNLAVGSLVCGILSLVLIFFGYGALLGLILGIVAIVLAVNAKKNGYEDGMQKAGLVLGIIGTVLCGISFVACALCAGALAAMGASM